MSRELGEIYVGDGVYASWDTYQIWLRTDRDEGSHKIALDFDTWTAVVQYGQKIWKVKT